MSSKNKSADDCVGREFLITHEFNAPRELVFKAWTDPKHLSQWWGPRGFTNPVCEWNAQPGKAIYVVMRAPNGADYPMGGEFREIVAPERLVFTTGAMDDKGKLLFEFLHTAVFIEQGGKTRLTLQSRVINASEGASKYIGGFEAGMTQSLEKLADKLAKNGAAVIVDRIFDAPVAQVWKALTSKQAFDKWFFDIQEFKPEVGFEFQFTAGDEKTKYVHLCKITDLIPEKRLAYSWRYEGHEGDSLVTIELFADGDKTRLQLTHEGLETFPKTPPFAPANFEAGWTHIMGTSLKEFVETTSK